MREGCTDRASQAEKLSRASTEKWKEAFWAVRTMRSKVDRTFDVTGTARLGLGGGAGSGQVLMAAPSPASAAG